MPRTTLNSQNVRVGVEENGTPQVVGSLENLNEDLDNQSGNPGGENANTSYQNQPINVSLSESQFSDLISNLKVRQEIKASFSSCSARFNGGANTANVEDFIATIVVFKHAEKITDSMALLSFPLLLEGYASSWWQGVQQEAKTFEEAIQLLRSAFAPPKPDWRIYSEIFQDKQKSSETTDNFICRKRSLFAQLKERLPESTTINMIFSLLYIKIREKIPRESVSTFQELLYKAREIELLQSENKAEELFKPEAKEKTLIRCAFCRKKNHTAVECYKRIELEKRKNQMKINYIVTVVELLDFTDPIAQPAITKTSWKVQSNWILIALKQQSLAEMSQQ